MRPTDFGWALERKSVLDHAPFSHKLPVTGPADLDQIREWAKQELGADQAVVSHLVTETAVLRTACRAALSWVRNMRVVPGGERDKLRIQLCLALGEEP